MNRPLPAGTFSRRQSPDSGYGATTVDLAAPGVTILSTAASSGSGADTIVQVNAKFFAAIPLTHAGTISGITHAVYDCGPGNPGQFPAGVNGNIALIARGTLTFSAKVSNAMAADARAAII